MAAGPTASCSDRSTTAHHKWRSGNPLLRTTICDVRRVNVVPTLCLSQIGGRRPALLAALDVIAQPLAFAEVGDSRALDGGDVDEHILRAVFGLDEPVALLRVEPFDRADGHDDPLIQSFGRANE